MISDCLADLLKAYSLSYSQRFSKLKCNTTSDWLNQIAYSLSYSQRFSTLKRNTTSDWLNQIAYSLSYSPRFPNFQMV